MAKVRSNILLKGVTGMIGGQLVIRRQADGTTIVSAPPVQPEHREPTPAQEKIQEHFRQGALYAKGAKDNPAYAPIAKDKHLSTYAVAMADFLHPPEIHDIDVSGYTGSTAQAIIIRATDDVKVTTVGVLIATDAGVVVEKGKAVQSTHDPHVWTYTTSAAAPSASVKIVVDAADLAGQISELSAHT
jgi:hypothetical protein